MVNSGHMITLSMVIKIKAFVDPSDPVNDFSRHQCTRGIHLIHFEIKTKAGTPHENRRTPLDNLDVILKSFLLKILSKI